VIVELLAKLATRLDNAVRETMADSAQSITVLIEESASRILEQNNSSHFQTIQGEIRTLENAANTGHSELLSELQSLSESITKYLSDGQSAKETHDNQASQL
jgi:flagellar motor switch protein FliG